MGFLSGFNSETAKSIYRSNRQKVDRLISSGTISREEGERQWACGVSRDLKNSGFSVPKGIDKKCQG